MVVVMIPFIFIKFINWQGNKKDDATEPPNSKIFKKCLKGKLWTKLRKHERGCHVISTWTGAVQSLILLSWVSRVCFLIVAGSCFFVFCDDIRPPHYPHRCRPMPVELRKEVKLQEASRIELRQLHFQVCRKNYVKLNVCCLLLFSHECSFTERWVVVRHFNM